MSTPRKPDPLSDLPAGQSADQVGMYHWDIRVAKWTWSSEVYLMYGYRPGSVEPGLDRHQARPPHRPAPAGGRLHRGPANR